MSEFTYLFRGGRPAGAPPEQWQQQMQKWVAWIKQLGEKGYIKDQGRPLERTDKIVTSKEKTIVDGPYAETKNIINRYMLIEAKDLTNALKISKNYPILDIKNSIKVRPVMKVDI